MFDVKCNTATCQGGNYLGRFDTPEEAAQAYLQHWEKKHPAELEKERAPPPPPPVLPEVQHHLLIPSDKKNRSSGFPRGTSSSPFSRPVPLYVCL
jgi:hypothetical protein